MNEKEHTWPETVDPYNNYLTNIGRPQSSFSVQAANIFNKIFCYLTNACRPYVQAVKLICTVFSLHA